MQLLTEEEESIKSMGIDLTSIGTHRIYSPETTALSNHVDHLASHLAGIDTKLGQAAAAESHASSHITAGTDEIDGDKLDVDWTPANYTQWLRPSQTTSIISPHTSRGLIFLLGNLDFTARTGLASNLSAIGIKDAATIDTNTVASVVP